MSMMIGGVKVPDFELIRTPLDKDAMRTLVWQGDRLILNHFGALVTDERDTIEIVDILNRTLKLELY